MPTYDCLISVEKRILLHLLNYSHHEYKYNVPIALTQKGIAQATGANEGYVSTPIRKFVAKGEVQEHLGRVRGGKRRQKYYMITIEGKKKRPGIEK
jgi:DNA-binding MarR family transcriptional regulator